METIKVDRYIFKDINGDKVAIDNPEFKKIESEYLYKEELLKSRIPKFYWGIDFKDYIGTRSLPNVENCKKYSRNLLDPQFKDVNLYLYGSLNGSQKTATMCNIGKHAIKQGLKVRFATFGSLVAALIKNQGYSKNEDADEMVKDLSKAEFLLLDDCFDPNKSILWKDPTSRTLIISEIDNFIRVLIYNNKRIVMTSNFSFDYVKENYGQSLYAMLDRNFHPLEFLDSVAEKRKERLTNIFN